MVRKGGLEPPCLSAPPPQDGVSANFTTSALKNYFIFNHLWDTLLGAPVQCIHFCHYLLHRTVRQKLPASQSRQPGKERVDRVSLRVDVTHRRLDVIVAGHVLQRKGVSVLAGLGQERVPAAREARRLGAS